jgi:hypothetical protein
VRFERTILLAVVGAGLLGATWAESQSAHRKFEAIDGLRSGASVSFTSGELSSWMAEEAKNYAPQGVNGLRLELGEGRATGYAQIDFLKLRQAETDRAPGWLERNLLSGQRPVMVKARFESRQGRARVDLERVEVSGVPIEGRALDFLIQRYLRPSFPQAKLSEWFELDSRVDHFTVSPRGATVFAGR